MAVEEVTWGAGDLLGTSWGEHLASGEASSWIHQAVFGLIFLLYQIDIHCNVMLDFAENSKWSLWRKEIGTKADVWAVLLHMQKI